MATRASKKKAVAPVAVMLVDDHPMWRDTVRRILERARLARIVAEAGSEPEAVAMAAKCKPEVVLMDIQLGDTNGIDATRSLVKADSKIKVLVLASSDARAQVLQAVEAGACGYLLKTASSDEVRDAVRRVAAGEMVFPAALSGVVLSELRGSGEAEPVEEPSHSLRLEGDYWTIVFQGEVIRLKSTRGVQYLSVLLRNPGREIHALDLVAGGKAVHDLAGERPESVLDPKAKDAYRQRLRDLEQEASEAEDWGDAERARRARDEIQTVAEELGTAVGLGGRDRKAAASAERARVSVTLAIKPTLAKIARHSKPFGDHLAVTVKTGMYCSYAPDPANPVRWS